MFKITPQCAKLPAPTVLKNRINNQLLHII